MACGCTKRSNVKYKWTGVINGVTMTRTYDTEIQAKAKVLRKGGSYEPVEG